MTGLEIGLLVVGILFFAGSFFFSEKLSSSDIQTLEKMSEREVNVLMDRHIKKADNRISAAIDNRLNEALNKFDREAAKKTTDELFSISEHADSVVESMQPQLEQMRKAHKEVMFIYNMLNEKQEKVTELEKEAGQLESALKSVHDKLRIGGRCICVTFHSLEDRIVKNTFRKWSEYNGDPRLPTIKEPEYKLLKTYTPSDEELEKNSRARSAHMRAVEKV